MSLQILYRVLAEKDPIGRDAQGRSALTTVNHDNVAGDGAAPRARLASTRTSMSVSATCPGVALLNNPGALVSPSRQRLAGRGHHRARPDSRGALARLHQEG